MPRFSLIAALLFVAALAVASDETPFEAGFGEADITPPLKDKTVYLAGFGHNRKATGVHDPLKARAVVLRHGQQKWAIVSLDVVGFFLPHVERVRKRLTGFTCVLVSSTHNHEGPDTMGLWGATPLQCGIDRDYLRLVEDRIVDAVRAADSSRQAVTVRLGTTRAPELLHDARAPYVKHDELTTLAFRDGKDRLAGLVVGWHCHPETLDSKNTLVSADFVGYVVEQLQRRHRCPVVYLTGTVGGLMTSLRVEVRDAAGKPLADGTYEKTARYGELLADAADRALKAAKPLRTTPLEARTRSLFLPLENPMFLLARTLGVIDREAYLWKGDSRRADPVGPKDSGRPLCLRTEIAYLRLGDLHIAAIPGEIYPELVLGRVQNPADPGADFPDAPAEPGIYPSMPGPHRLLIGLANDEIGYILPKRQWDVKPPYCYGRKKSQYGEINSLGPDTAPLLCEAFRNLTNKK